MADDYDFTDDIGNLDDDELRALVLGAIRENPMLDGDAIGVHVHRGHVTVSGTVGTEEEARILDHVLTDSVGLTEMKNNVVVDELYRAESPEPIDEHLADEQAHEGLAIADKAVPFSPEAEHLADMTPIESLEHDEGTHEVGKAIEDAEPWIPPEGPTPEGLSGNQNEGTFGHDTQH
jgi:hypothetical protein